MVEEVKCNIESTATVAKLGREGGPGSDSSVLECNEIHVSHTMCIFV